MRNIGSVQDATQAQVFGEFLVSRGIRNQIEREAEGQWTVWIYEDDQLAAAEAWLSQFRAAPNAPEFRAAVTEAAKVRQAEAEDLAAYRKRIRTRQSLFPKFGGYGVGVLTYALIAGCVLVAALSRLGDDHEFLRRLFIGDPMVPGTQFLPEVRKGEVWRLFTPIFIHFGPWHLIFNMLWLYQLGCMIEARKGSLYFAALVAVIALCSNVAQYYFGGRFSFHGITMFVGNLGALFGGMSGVVYGLAGFVWIRGRLDRASGLFLDPQSVTILLAWLVFCYTGYLGPVANTAHVVGLVVGMIWGWASASLAPRRPG